MNGWGYLINYFKQGTKHLLLFYLITSKITTYKQRRLVMKQSKFIIQHINNHYNCNIGGKEYYFDNVVDTVHYIAVLFKYEVQVITSIESFIHWSVKPRGLARGYKRLI